jgi:hypothetical protein
MYFSSPNDVSSVYLIAHNFHLMLLSLYYEIHKIFVFLALKYPKTGIIYYHTNLLR